MQKGARIDGFNEVPAGQREEFHGVTHYLLLLLSTMTLFDDMMKKAALADGWINTSKALKAYGVPDDVSHETMLKSVCE